MSAFITMQKWECSNGHYHLTPVSRKPPVYCPSCKRAGINSEMTSVGHRRVSGAAFSQAINPRKEDE